MDKQSVFMLMALDATLVLLQKLDLSRQEVVAIGEVIAKCMRQTMAGELSTPTENIKEALAEAMKLEDFSDAAKAKLQAKYGPLVAANNGPTCRA